VSSPSATGLAAVSGGSGIALMFEAKHRADAPRDLLEASDAAFSHIPAIFKAGQGLVSISTDGKFKSVPLETLVPATVKHILLGLRPR
jgi:hypothetical protein